MWTEREDHFPFDKQKDVVVVDEKVQGYEKICTVNREDFSLLEMDEEFKYLMANLEIIAGCGSSTWKTINMNGNLEMQTSSLGIQTSSLDGAVVEQVQAYREICTVNREDFSLLEMDESLMANKQEIIDGCQASTWGNINMNENPEMHTSPLDVVVVHEQVQGCKGICTVNREDFSVLEMDEEFKYLMANNLEIIAGGSSSWRNINMNENLEMQTSSLGIQTSSLNVAAVEQVQTYREIRTVNREDFSLLEMDESLMANKQEIIDGCQASTWGNINMNEYPEMYTSPSDVVVDDEQVQGCKGICTVNREDFSLLEIDESLMANNLEILGGCGGSTWRSINMIDNPDIQASSSGTSLQERTDKKDISSSDVIQIVHSDTNSNFADTILFENSVHFAGAYRNNLSGENVAHPLILIDSFDMENFEYSNHINSKIDNVNVDSAVETLASDANSKLKIVPWVGRQLVVKDSDYLNSNFVHEDLGSAAEISSNENSPLLIVPQAVKHFDGIDSNLEHRDMDSDAETISSHNDSLLQIAPWVGRQLVGKYSHYDDLHFLSKIVKNRFKLHSSSEVAQIANPDRIPKISCSLVPLQRVSWQNFLKKRKLDHSLSSENTFKLHKNLEPQTEAATKSINKANASHNGKENIFEKSVTGKTLMRAEAEDDVFSSDCSIYSGRIEIKDNRIICGRRFLSKHVNLPKSHQKKKHHLSHSFDPVDLTRFYACPLVRDIPHSNRNERKPSMTDGYNEKHKTLHMKFPKNFNLPSREELDKKFGVFGPLDCSRTRVFFYTGAAEVVFVNHENAGAAYRYVKRKGIFPEANVLYWFDEYESRRKRQGLDELLASKSYPYNST
ncbi:uncharacterized protein LOC141829925 [Curcuma longa]|uniref:uncharacterized protein LOC141829925 n=1 Tax=Curcuma longa TaxID=136217 RepID=UPI003D9DC8C1